MGVSGIKMLGYIEEENSFLTCNNEIVLNIFWFKEDGMELIYIIIF